MITRRSHVRRTSARAALVAVAALLAFSLAVIATLRELTSLRALSARGGGVRDTVTFRMRAAPWAGSDLRVEYSNGRDISPAPCDSLSCPQVR